MLQKVKMHIFSLSVQKLGENIAYFFCGKIAEDQYRVLMEYYQHYGMYS